MMEINERVINIDELIQCVGKVLQKSVEIKALEMKQNLL